MIGYEGQSNARYEDIDISELLELWPDCTPSLIHKRSTDEASYPVVTELNGNILRWTFSLADTAIKGYGKAQIIMTNSDGTVVGKSQLIKTYTNRSLETGAAIPEAASVWVDKVLAKAQRIEEILDGTQDIIREAVGDVLDNKADKADIPEPYDDTEIKNEIKDLQDNKADKTQIPSAYDDSTIKADIKSLQDNKADKTQIPEVYNDTAIRNDIKDLQDNKADKDQIPAPYNDASIKADIKSLQDNKADKTEIPAPYNDATIKADIKALQDNKANADDIPEPYDDSAIKADIKSLQDNKANKSEIPAPYNDATIKADIKSLQDNKADKTEIPDEYDDTEIRELIDDKQDTLTAGDNITIQGNVISAANNGGDIIQDPEDPDGLVVAPGTLADIDQSLTLAGYAADAKVVGDKISDIQDDVAEKLTSPASVETGKYFRVAGIDDNGHAILEAVDLPIAALDKPGVIRGSYWGGILISDAVAYVYGADKGVIDAKNNQYRPINPYYLDYAIRAGLIANTEITDADKPLICKTIGVEPDDNWQLIETFTTSQASALYRDCEPDGTPYNFREIWIVFETISTSEGWNGGNIYIQTGDGKNTDLSHAVTNYISPNTTANRTMTFKASRDHGFLILNRLGLSGINDNPSWSPQPGFSYAYTSISSNSRSIKYLGDAPITSVVTTTEFNAGVTMSIFARRY